MTKNVPIFSKNFFSAFDTLEEAFERLPDPLDKFGFSHGSWTNSNFPPHNVVKVSNQEHLIEMAIAGYDPKDIEVALSKDGTNMLVISGVSKNEENTTKQYLQKGISTKKFSKQFKLAENVKVAGAVLNNGILTIQLKQETPELPKVESIWEKIPVSQTERKIFHVDLGDATKEQAVETVSKLQEKYRDVK